VEQSNRPAVRSTVEDIEAVLRVTPVFRALAPADRRRVAEAATIRHYRKGERIFEQEAPADAFYTIATGRVKIFRM
jgi:CRP-like cAMP-binding protein